MTGDRGELTTARGRSAVQGGRAGSLRGPSPGRVCLCGCPGGGGRTACPGARTDGAERRRRPGLGRWGRGKSRGKAPDHSDGVRWAAHESAGCRRRAHPPGRSESPPPRRHTAGAGRRPGKSHGGAQRRTTLPGTSVGSRATAARRASAGPAPWAGTEQRTVRRDTADLSCGRRSRRGSTGRSVRGRPQGGTPLVPGDGRARPSPAPASASRPIQSRRTRRTMRGRPTQGGTPLAPGDGRARPSPCRRGRRCRFSRAERVAPSGPG